MGSYEKGQSEIPHGNPAGLWAEAQEAEGSLHWPVSAMGIAQLGALPQNSQTRGDPAQRGSQAPRSLTSLLEQVNKREPP